MLKRLSVWYKNIALWLGRVWDVLPLCGNGVVLLSVLGVGLWKLGWQEADLIILLAAVSLVVLVLLLSMVVWVAAWSCWRRQLDEGTDGSGLRLKVGVKSFTGFCFPQPRFPWVEVSWEWLYPAEVEVEVVSGERGEEEKILPKRRCLVDKVTRRFVVKDVLGVCAVRWRREQDLDVMVLPSEVELNESTLIRTFFDGDDMPDPDGVPRGDRVDMRRYTAGDPPRLILWKVYARTGKLMVRMPERAVVAQPRTCAYFIAGRGDELCAALMRTILECNLLGAGWRFGADGTPGGATDIAEALRILARSGNREVKGCGLGPFIEEAACKGYKSCLVLVPPVEGDWLDTLVSVVERSRIDISVMTVSSFKERRPSWWREFLFVPEADARQELLFLWEALAHKVRKLLVFDSRKGEIVDLRGLLLQQGYGVKFQS